MEILNKIQCPVCGSKKYKCKKNNGGFKLGYCVNCTTAYSQPLIKGGHDDVGRANSTITEAQFYEELIENHVLQSRIAETKAPKMLKYWKKILGNNTKKNISVLEIGCGTGQYYDAWKELNVEWTGFEVNKDMLEFCRLKGIPVSNIDIMNISLEDKYDIVFLSQVLEHILDPNQFLIKVREIMNDGGVLHIDVPNHDSISSVYRKLHPFHPEYGFLQPNHHLIAYTKKSLSYLLKKNDFKPKMNRSFSNNDSTFGQLIIDGSFKNLIYYWLSNLFGRGSLLVAVATK